MGLDPLLLQRLDLVGVRLLDLIHEVIDAFFAVSLMPETPSGELLMGEATGMSTNDHGPSRWS